MTLSRRGFLRTSAAAAAALPMWTEPMLARAERAAAVTRGEGRPIRIDANENPLGPCEAARASMTGLMAEGGRYDSDLTEKLAATFAAQEGLRPENVAVYAGSSEPLHYAVLAFTSPDRAYVTADPGYEAGMRAAVLNRAPVVKVPLTATHAHDTRAMLATAPRGGVFYICNPNNPTGTTTPRAAIEEALAHKPAGSILLIDEAYIHFSDATPSLDLVKAGKDVIVLRTFSKLYGMAGIRCGLAVARPDLLARFDYYGMNAMPILAVAAAETSLRQPGLIAERKAVNTKLREETFRWLRTGGYSFMPSESNCFMLETGRPGREALAAMARRGVHVGRVWPVMPTHVRVTVGTGEEMAAFREAFGEVMRAPKSVAVRAWTGAGRSGILS